LHGQAQFRAHTVGPGNQYRLLIAFGQFEKSAESPKARKYFRAARALSDGFDPVHQSFSGVDVHARVFVTQGLFLGIAHRVAYISLPLRRAGAEKAGILAALAKGAKFVAQL